MNHCNDLVYHATHFLIHFAPSGKIIHKLKLQLLKCVQEMGESSGSCTNGRQEPDTETVELLILIEKYPVIILTLLVSPHIQECSYSDKKDIQHISYLCTKPYVIYEYKYILKCVCLSFWLQDMVCNREAPLAERALGVLEAVLSSQKCYEADLCVNLRLALLQVLQRLGMENVVHNLGQGHTGMREPTHSGYQVHNFFISR